MFEEKPVAESATIQGIALTAAPIILRAFTTKRLNTTDLFALGGLAYAAYGRLRKGDLKLR